MVRLLLIDDEYDFRRALAEYFRLAGYDVVEGATTREGVARAEAEAFDVVVADLRMPGASGLEVLRAASMRSPTTILVVLTAYGSLDTAIEALRIGAHDFVEKPVNLEGFLAKVNLLVEHQSILAENRLLRRQGGVTDATAELIGTHPSMAHVRDLVARVAATDSTVLVSGETGTGKELAARAIHELSARRDRPFVAINCGAIPETLLESELFGYVRGAFSGAERDKKGLIEVAGNGTFFLDEIGELPLSLQPKILRVLEAREIRPVGSTTVRSVPARFLAASHRDLADMVRRGTFRADLYYRLQVIDIRMPPLREIPEDLASIARRILTRLCSRMNRPVPELGRETVERLQRYSWPGNVRELSNVLERALLRSAEGGLEIPRSDLIASVGDAMDDPSVQDLRQARATFERAHIHRVLDRVGGDKRLAARALGIALASLYRKLEE